MQRGARPLLVNKKQLNKKKHPWMQRKKNGHRSHAIKYSKPTAEVLKLQKRGNPSCSGG